WGTCILMNTAPRLCVPISDDHIPSRENQHHCPSTQSSISHSKLCRLRGGVTMKTSFACRHCGKETQHPRAAYVETLDTLLMSRIECQHCKREFLIVNNTPWTEEACRLRSEVPRNQ